MNTTLQQVQSDLQEIKMKLSIGNEIPSPETDLSSTSIPDSSLPLPPTIPKIETFMKTIHEAIYSFVFQLPEGITCNCYQTLDSSSSVDSLLESSSSSDILSKEFIAGVDLLLLFIKNLLKNPTIPRYRRISTTNSSFKTSLLPLASHKKVLESLGFQFKQQGNSYEWEWGAIMDNLPTVNKGDLKSSQQQQPSKEMIPALLENCVTLLLSLKDGGKKKFLETIQLQRNIGIVVEVPILPSVDSVNDLNLNSENLAKDLLPITPVKKEIESPPNMHNPSLATGGQKVNMNGFLTKGSPLLSSSALNALKFDDVSIL